MQLQGANTQRDSIREPSGHTGLKIRTASLLSFLSTTSNSPVSSPTLQQSSAGACSPSLSLLSENSDRPYGRHRFPLSCGPALSSTPPFQPIPMPLCQPPPKTQKNILPRTPRGHTWHRLRSTESRKPTDITHSPNSERTNKPKNRLPNQQRQTSYQCPESQSFQSQMPRDSTKTHTLTHKAICLHQREASDAITVALRNAITRQELQNGAVNMYA